MNCEPWTVWMVRGKAEDGATVYLADYCGQIESDVRWKVYMGMMRERFTGTVNERLTELGWEIVECELHPVEPNPNFQAGGTL